MGRFQGHDVRFHSKLKKPVMTKRSSTSTSKASTSSPSPSVVPTHEEPSGLRVLVSSPPPIVEVIPSPALPALLPEDQMASSTSSASDLALATPVHTHMFESSLEEKQVVQEDIQQVEEDGAIHISAPMPANRDMIPTISPTIPVAVTVNDKLPNPHSYEPERKRVPEPAVASGTSYEYDDEASTRISVALSDGEVGIGLSLLQDFAGGGGEAMVWTDSESESGDESGRSTPEADVRSPYRDSVVTAL